MDALSRFHSVGEEAARAALRTWIGHPAVLPEVRARRPGAQHVVAPLAAHLDGGAQSRIVRLAALCLGDERPVVLWCPDPTSDLAAAVRACPPLTPAEAHALPGVVTDFRGLLLGLGRCLEEAGADIDGQAVCDLLALAQLLLIPATDEVPPDELVKRLLVVPPGAWRSDGGGTTVSALHASGTFERALGAARREIAARVGRGYRKPPRRRRSDAVRLEETLAALVAELPDLRVKDLLDVWSRDPPRYHQFLAQSGWKGCQPPDERTLRRHWPNGADADTYGRGHKCDRQGGRDA